MELQIRAHQKLATRKRIQENFPSPEKEKRETNSHLGDPRCTPPKKNESNHPAKRRGRESNYESENRGEKNSLTNELHEEKRSLQKNAPSTPQVFIMQLERLSSVGSLHPPPLIDFILLGHSGARISPFLRIFFPKLFQ